MTVLFSRVLIINGRYLGRQCISNYSLSEEFDAGDFGMIDANFFNEVTKYSRKEQCKVVVFTY